MNKRICFNTYEDWQGIFNKLDSDSCKELLMAVFSYGLKKEIPELSFAADLAFTSIKPLMDRDWGKYEKIVERNKINSKNAGRPKKSKEIENNPLDFLDSQNNRNEPTGTQSGPIINNNIINNEIINKDNIESKDSLSINIDSEDKISYVEIVDFYNKSVRGSNISQCAKLTEKRKQAIKARVIEYGKDRVFEAITKVVKSSFCNGKNNRNWKADFDFIFNSNKMANILEGRYDNEINNYGNNGNSNERNAREVGESALRDIFAEMEERRRIEGVSD